MAEEEDQRCLICLHPPQEPTTINGCTCGHRWCLECLRKWSSSRPSPRCPLCQAPISVLRRPGGEEEEVHPPSAPLPDESSPDLSCLDHAFFAGEAGRLLSRARSAQLELVRQSYGGGRRGHRAADDASDTLAAVIQSLDQTREDMRQEVPFASAEELLHELYQLDQIVCSIAAGDFSTAPPPSSTSGGGGGGPISADDAWHAQHEDWDSDEDWESGEDPDALYHAAARRLSRASLGGGSGGGNGGLGRRPTPGRRRSSGNLVQSRSSGSVSSDRRR